jgi:hypothetical protein
MPSLNMLSAHRHSASEVHLVGSFEVSSSGWTYRWSPMTKAPNAADADTLRLELSLTPPNDMALTVMSTLPINIRVPAPEGVTKLAVHVDGGAPLMIDIEE